MSECDPIRRFGKITEACPRIFIMNWYWKFSFAIENVSLIMPKIVYLKMHLRLMRVMREFYI